jgi:tetratricopeptide (TPR) repeat protein
MNSPGRTGWWLVVSVLVLVFFVVGRFLPLYPLVWLDVVRYYDAPQVLFEKGEYYFSESNYDVQQAKAYYEAATWVAGGYYPGAYYQIARIHFITGELDEALVFINKELEVMPAFKRSYYVRALVYAYQGNFSLAENDFKQFLLWKPESWAAWNDISWVYFSEGKYKEALNAALAGLHYAPDNPWLNNSAGAAHLNLGHYADAYEFFNQSLIKTRSLGEIRWGRAYPGNNPRIYSYGYAAMIRSIEKNIQLAKAHLSVD